MSRLCVGEWRYSCIILNLSLRWNWVVTFMHLLRNFGETVCYPFSRRLGGSQSWTECCGEEKNVLLLPEIEPQFLGHPACSLVIILTELSQLLYTMIFCKQNINTESDGLIVCDICFSSNWGTQDSTRLLDVKVSMKVIYCHSSILRFSDHRPLCTW
jgi:hypothetical protein